MRGAWLKIAVLLVPSVAHADARADFDAARERWRAADIRSYSFVYRSADAVLIAPRCAGARIRTYVSERKPRLSVVLSGSRGCAAGSRLPDEVRRRMPRTIDALFESMEHLFRLGPEQVELRITYDPVIGYPTSMSATKLLISDNDEGFVVTEFAPKK